MITKLSFSLFFLMFAIIGNAPEVVQGARRPINCVNLPIPIQLRCCLIWPSANGCEMPPMLPNFGFRSLARLGGPRLLGPEGGLQYPGVDIDQVVQARAWNWGCNFCWLCYFHPLDYKTCYDRCVKNNC